MFYELSTLTLPFGAAAAASERVAAFCQDPTSQGPLLGCWMSDIGRLNQMWVLRGFASREALADERVRVRASASPFGCGDLALAQQSAGYEAFDWMPPVQPSAVSGIRGPVYEIREYGIKPGGVAPTVELWRQAMPARAAILRCVVAMVALDGPLRFTNIWAYASLDARTKARGDAVAQGIWPPKGGPAHLTTSMVSIIALPMAVSPLQ